VTSPVDPGLQAERTSLAWRRTALAVAIGSLVGLRLLPPRVGAVGYVVCALGLVWSADLATTAVRRYRESDAVLRSRGRGRGRRVGATVARTAFAAGLIGLAALLFVVVLALD
jgi:uncharacterized membrane protein YidH (DUF202 family)